MCVCARACACAYACKRACVRLFVCLSVSVCLCVCVSVCVCVCVYVCVCICVRKTTDVNRHCTVTHAQLLSIVWCPHRHNLSCSTDLTADSSNSAALDVMIVVSTRVKRLWLSHDTEYCQPAACAFRLTGSAV